MFQILKHEVSLKLGNLSNDLVLFDKIEGIFSNFHFLLIFKFFMKDNWVNRDGTFIFNYKWSGLYDTYVYMIIFIQIIVIFWSEKK